MNTTDEKVLSFEDIVKPENLVYEKPRLLNDNTMHYCPGCSHGVVHKLVAEVIDEMGLAEESVGIAPVGCSVFAYNYIDIDWQEAAHGRAPALATAIKRLYPSKLVFTYQGDGDLSAIGTAETIHAASTLVGMKTATCPYGRDVKRNGYPISMSNLLAELDGTCYVTRQTVHTMPAVRKAKKALIKAFENSMAGKGCSVVEIVATCNTGWKMSPAKANDWMMENMAPKYTLGDLKDVDNQ